MKPNQVQNDSLTESQFIMLCRGRNGWWSWPDPNPEYISYRVWTVLLNIPSIWLRTS
jgi:hypothetical protein